MLLVLEDKHKEHLSFLTSVSLDVVREFCNISLEFIQKEANLKVYQNAAQKLEVDLETVQNGVEGLIFLLAESSRLMLSDVDFVDTLLAVGFEQDLRELLLEVYVSRRAEVRAALAALSLTAPQYHDLEWRFDVQLASRSLQHQVTPLILLRLSTEDGAAGRRQQLLQTDPTSLVQLTRRLEEALKEMKAAHTRRILRNI